MAFSYVGEDVVMDILSRLPVKSIVRFKCVCKTWYAIIKTRYFITKHLQRNLRNLNVAPLFAISYENRGSIWWISEGVVPSIDPDSPPFSNCTQSMIMGPVHGIYCEIRGVFDGDGYEEDELFLCNPSLREVKSLPEVTLPPMTHRPQGRDFSTNVFGFGYDSRSNDFKVVVVTCTEPKFVFVYSLSSNSWRHFEHNTLPGFYTNHPQVFTSHGNGVVHHLGFFVEEPEEPTPSPSPNYTMVILSFDLGTEVFKNLKLPPGVMIYSNPRRPDQFLYKEAQLTTFFNDSIVLILKSCDHCSDEYYYEIFVMKEYGVEESWTKLYNVGPLLEVTWAFKVWKNGEILFTQEVVAEYHRGLVLFNPHCPQQMKDLHIPRPFHVYSYMESLVSIS